MKINFTESGVAYRDDFDGQYEVSDDLVLLHRYELIDNDVVDKYDGATDDEVRRIDYQTVVDAYAANVDEDGNPAPLDPPPYPFADGGDA